MWWKQLVQLPACLQRVDRQQQSKLPQPPQMLLLCLLPVVLLKLRWAQCRRLATSMRSSSWSWSSWQVERLQQSPSCYWPLLKTGAHQRRQQSSLALQLLNKVGSLPSLGLVLP